MDLAQEGPERALDAPLSQARAHPGIASAPGGAPAVPEVAAGRLVASPLRARAIAPHPAAIAPRPAPARLEEPAPVVTEAQAPPTRARARAAPTVAAALPVPPARLRPWAPIPAVRAIGVPDRLSTGTPFQVVGHKHSGLHPSERVAALRRAVDGIGRRPDVTALRLRGAAVPGCTGRRKHKATRILGRSRARSAAPPLPVATSGRGHRWRRGRNRPQGESSQAGT